MSILTTPEALLGNVRDWLDEPSAAYWTDDILMKRLHEAQQEIVMDVVEEQPSEFVAEYDVTTVIDQALYDLPLNARLGTRWMAAENRLSGSPYFYLFDVDLRRYLMTENTNWPWNSEGTPHVTFQGAQVRLTPAPSDAVTDGIRIAYHPMYGNMLQGAATATSSTTFRIFSGAADYSSTFGLVDPRNDYYNGMEAFVISGPGLGQYRTISDYNGTTREFTVSSAFSTALSTASVIGIMSPVPEDFRQVQVMLAAKKAGIKGRNRAKDIDTTLYGVPGRPGAWHKMKGWFAQRHEFRGEGVEMWGPSY